VFHDGDGRGIRRAERKADWPAQCGIERLIALVENETPPTVQFSATNYSISETGISATITVTLYGSASAVTSTVNYATSNGTATAGSDYTASNGTLTFPAGTTTRTFNIDINDNGQYEGNETVNLTLSAPVSATLGSPNPATLTIVENDPAPVISLGAGPSVNEEAGTVTLNVTLNAASAVTTTVNYATSNGTASAGGDYTATSGTLVFPPTITSQSINVTLINDTTYELNETFTLNLSVPVSGTLGASAATVTVLNAADLAPVVQFSPAALTLGEDRGPATITVTLSAVSAVTATVNYSATNGTATAGSDFSATSSALTFAPGVTIQTLSVPIINDTTNEPNETFSVVTGALAHARTEAATNSTTTVTIANEDARPTCAIHKSANVPLAIPDNMAAGIDSILTVPVGSPILTDLSVRIESLQHTYMGDLRIELVAPGGQIITLIDNVGDDKDNLIYTVFNDGGVSLIGNNPPFTGTFRPNVPLPALGVLNGQVSTGTWKLRIADEVSGDTGTLHAWGLEVCGTVIPPTGITKIYLPIVRR
ncbi:MAG: Calx-beta domain-containing protein, partial [Anaerolineales bacterium]